VLLVLEEAKNLEKWQDYKREINAVAVKVGICITLMFGNITQLLSSISNASKKGAAIRGAPSSL
jgi:hypothetical protein